MRLHNLPGHTTEDGMPFAIVDEEAFCLLSNGSVRSEKKGHTTNTLQKAVRKKQLECEEHRVRTCCGSSLRKFVKVAVLHEGGEMRVLADIVTGSLYDIETGQCFTGNLKIEEWRNGCG
jgi:hypothetical protein